MAVAVHLDTTRFLDLLSKLIAQGKSLQNAPKSGLVPEETRAAELILEHLRPAVDSGWVESEMVVKAGVEERASLVLTVRGHDNGMLGIVGAHFDVVPADRETEGWLTDPFVLVVDEDGILRGRGVTDCLGHVALLAELLRELAERRLRPQKSLRVVLIANEEEAPIVGLGLDGVVEGGWLDGLKGETIYWLDSADFGPTLGTGGIARWELTAHGVSGHSGMPHQCVNALELAMAASLAIAHRFAETYGAHPEEARYGFASSSSLKATMVHCDNEKVTKIPQQATIEGDLRLTPFYDMADAVAAVERWVTGLNQQIQRGEVIDGFSSISTVKGEKGWLRWAVQGTPSRGIACDLESPGLRRLSSAIESTRGGDRLRPWSMTGSLPLVRDLQEQGYDVQITGFGESSSYHAPNERGNLADFAAGFEILWRLIDPS